MTFVSAMVVGLALAFVPLFLAVGDRGSSISSALPPIFAGLGVLVIGAAVSVPLIGFQDAPRAEIEGAL